MFILAVNSTHVMISTINGISSTSSAVPGLTQDDSDISYCNAINLPEHCSKSQICHCPHLIELKLCEVYEFLLIDARGEFKILSVKKRN